MKRMTSDKNDNDADMCDAIEDQIIDGDEDEHGKDDDVEIDPQVLLTAESKKSRVRRLVDLLSAVFPRDKPEDYMLFHQDLSGNNILVDKNHDIAGIIDWECVHTVPLWLGCQIPKFLHTQEAFGPPPFRNDFRNERDEKDYWRRIEEYEKTQLRIFFLEEMQRNCPEWIQVHRTGTMKADFEYAVDTVAMGATVHLELWLKQVKQGQDPPSCFSVRDGSGLGHVQIFRMTNNH